MKESLDKKDSTEGLPLKIGEWLGTYREVVKTCFGRRIWFLGLQGSYGRGEATKESDIDVVLILDNLTGEDLISYRHLLDTLPNREKICGFVSGREELLDWEPSDLFQFYYDTTPIVGSLDSILEKIRRDDIWRAVHTGACNVYHLCAHNLIHEKDLGVLRGLYKSAAFILQAAAFLQTGNYARQKAELMRLLRLEDQTILEAGIRLKEKEGELSGEELEESSLQLLEWASGWIRRCGQKRNDKSHGMPKEGTL